MNSTKTYIANALEAAGNKAKYDAEVKKILSDKYILSHIMRAVVSEFKDCTIEEVYAAIEGTPEVASVLLYQGNPINKQSLG